MARLPLAVLLALLLSLLLGAPAVAQPVLGEVGLPVAPACISSPFGARRAPGPHAIGFHNGIDLPAPAGGAVHAVADGTILSIHRRGPGGLEMTVAHRGSLGPYVTVYAHLGLIAPAFARGRTQVRRGERIAVIGRSGVTYGTHLFLALFVGGVPIDPAPYFPVRPCGEKP